MLLVPIGIWRQRRRVAAGRTSDEWPVIDLRLPRTRTEQSVGSGIHWHVNLDNRIEYMSHRVRRVDQGVEARSGEGSAHAGGPPGL